MSVVISIEARTCPDCRHAEHEGWVCNVAGGCPCGCPIYEWVDISEWQEEKKKERVADYEVIRPLPPLPPLIPPPPLTLAERLAEYLFTPYKYRPLKLVLVIEVVVIIISLFISTCISDIGFSHGE